METQLDIYIDEELLNPRILIIRDISYYAEDSEVTGGILDIQYPGSEEVLSFDIASGFFEIINSNTLGITSDCGSQNLADLPDGIWTIKYSVSEDVFVEVTFLRNTLQRVKYANAFCYLDSNKCSYKEYQSKFNDLKEINNMINAAKYLAYCCKYEKAIKLYNIAESLLDQFTGDCNCR